MASEEPALDWRFAQRLTKPTTSRRDLIKFAAITAGLAANMPSWRALAQSDAHPQGGQAIVGRAGDADTLDPHQTLASISWQTFSQIYEPLISFDLDKQYEGVLAESWVVTPDGKEYTFKLRQGIKFHDGTDLNADAVKFTFDRILDPATKAPNIAFISTPDLGLESTEVVDPYTVKMIMKAPFAPFLSALSLATFGILSPAAVEKYGADFGRNPVGTGPFKFKEWIAGESITLERNADYQNFHSYDENKGAAFIDNVVFRNLPEEETQLAAFDAGEINLLPSVPPHQVANYQDNSDVQLLSAQGTDIVFLEFAMKAPEGTNGAIFKPPFDDLKVRQALAYAVNADEIIDKVLEKQAIRNYGPLPTGNVGYDPDIEQAGYHYDADKANQLLDEAGWVKGDGDVRQKDGKPLSILFWTWSGGSEERSAQVIQNQLNAVGFDCKLETMENATFLSRLVEPDNPCNLDLVSWGWPEPDLLYLMSTVDAAFGFYRPENYRELISDARVEPDMEKRIPMYHDAMRIMLGDAAMVPLWTSILVTGVRKELQGFKSGPLPEIMDFQDAYTEG
jgi:peptide/nickel transport system substrate-binding protein